MNQVIAFFSNLLILSLLIGAIILIAAAARFIWITARFTYVIKLQKYNKNKMEAEREYNVISAENSQLMIANENVRESYAGYVIAIKEAEIKLASLEKKIESMETKLEDNEEPDEVKKKGPGRPPKQK